MGVGTTMPLHVMRPLIDDPTLCRALLPCMRTPPRMVARASVQVAPDGTTSDPATTLVTVPVHGLAAQAATGVAASAAVVRAMATSARPALKHCIGIPFLEVPLPSFG
jgi:hypothetical protein